MDAYEGAPMFLTENQIFFLRYHMMDTSQWAPFIGSGPGKGSTHSRGRSTSAPELSSSVALAPPSNGVGTSEELIEHIRLKCRLGTFSSGRRLQTKPNQPVFCIHSGTTPVAKWITWYLKSQGEKRRAAPACWYILLPHWTWYLAKMSWSYIH